MKQFTDVFDTMVAPVCQKRKVSKKTKKAWRKHIDIKDVDAYLDNARLEERLGPPLAEKGDDELFAIDIKGTNESVAILSKRERRLNLLNKPPTCFAILRERSMVPDPISKRNRVRTIEERKNPITRRLEAKRKLSGQLKLKEKIAKVNRAHAEAKRAKKPKRDDFNTDVWKEKSLPVPELNNEWIRSDTVRHTLTNLGMTQKKVPTTLHKKTSVLPAVEAPHPGTSYNPSYADHQKLLREIAESELKLMKEEAHLERVTSKMFKKIPGEDRDKARFEELSQGLPFQTEGTANEPESEDDDPTVKSVNPPVKNAKKTLVKRRKLKEQKELAHKRAQEKIEKRKVADIYKLNQLKKQLTFKEKKEEAMRKKRDIIKEKKTLEPKTLSKIKFEPEDQVFQLGTELTGVLRTSKPTGSLLKDRFKSLQQRNILAPTAQVLKRNKAKVKLFEKASHKMGWEGTFK
ncbi:ribosome biogenesis protein NOP53 [Orussus abietinus]|uniref:ribosome biogenesis protein NOP53 n=1 Tax=Orussus abietinus TaxID=222816 RepID=UPI000625B627|nr:ribosome biogenesis protein NOP53 [Orussus abietinus]